MASIDAISLRMPQTGPEPGYLQRRARGSEPGLMYGGAQQRTRESNDRPGADRRAELNAGPRAGLASDRVPAASSCWMQWPPQGPRARRALRW